jgi:hypothetical protein
MMVNNSLVQNFNYPYFFYQPELNLQSPTMFVPVQTQAQTSSTRPQMPEIALQTETAVKKEEEEPRRYQTFPGPLNG